jgi:hypothetical protein
MDRKNSAECLTTDVGKPCEVKRLWRFIPSIRALPLCMSTKLDKPSFVGMEFQAKLGHPFLQSYKAFSRVGFTAEADDKVVCIADYHYGSIGYPFPPLFYP